MTQALFEDQMSALPATMLPRVTVLMPSGGHPAPVRHVDGYGDFIAYVEEAGSDPTRLRDDLRALLEFVQSHPDVTAEESMLRSAGAFLGNSVAWRYPAARWQVVAEPEITVEHGGGFPVARGLRDMTVHPEWNDRYIADLDRELGSAT
jgi:hypothetical protein